MNIRKQLLKDIIIMSIISGIITPFIIRVVNPALKVSLNEFSVSLISNFALGMFIYYVLVRGNLRDYFDTLSGALRSMRKMIEKGKSESLEKMKSIEIKVEGGDLVYGLTREFNFFVKKLYENELLDSYQRKMAKVFANLYTVEELSKQIYSFLLSKFGIVALAVYMKGLGGVENVACINFTDCKVTDFVKSSFELRELKLLNVKKGVNIVSGVEVGEILIVPISVKSWEGVMVLAKVDKFRGFELKFLRRMRDMIAQAFRNAYNYERLQRESAFDPLTGLYNRRFGKRKLGEMLALAERELKPVSVAMVDIDNFKSINDTFGHLAGDFILREVAKIISAHVRESDLSMRYGGEEFIVGIYGADSSRALSAMERIRAEVESHVFRFEGREIRVTVSIGVVTVYPHERLSINEIVERADRAMYEAKRSGKNRVVEFKEQSL